MLLCVLYNHIETVMHGMARQPTQRESSFEIPEGSKCCHTGLSLVIVKSI